MKKSNIALILAIVLIAGVFSASGVAAETDDGPQVRVNGYLVDFPDGQPFINEDARTLIPVRFVTEALGATVTWDGSTLTAGITKDGTTVEITIGSPDLRVTKNGSVSTVTMDTAAVLKDNRTYVPIRFVAEQLGAYVDYSWTHRTVGIWSDVLTPEQIEKLQAYDYTLPKVPASTYEEAKEKYDTEGLIYRYGTDRESFAEWANAREHLYEKNHGGEYTFRALGVKKNIEYSLAGTEEFLDYVVREAVAELSYESERVSIQFLTDPSCIYQPDQPHYLDATIRGIVIVEANGAISDDDWDALRKLFTEFTSDSTQIFPVDVHMTLFPRVGYNTIVRLDETF